MFLAIYMLHMSPDVQEIMNFSIVKPYKIVLVPGRRVVWCLDAGWWGAWTQGGVVPGMLAGGCSKDACLGYIYV